MGNELAIPNDAGEILRDKLRKSFLEVMPQEQLDDIISTEWRKFFDKNTPNDTYYYSSNNHDCYKDASPCTRLIRDEIIGHVRKQLEGIVERELANLTPWSNDKTFLARVIEESRDSLANALYANLVQSAVQTIRNNPPQY